MSYQHEIAGGYFFGAPCSLGLLLIKRLIDSSLIVKKFNLFHEA